jgi:predicted RNA-binding Zn-ribbon protein involved in translation (DUF1610 family)
MMVSKTKKKCPTCGFEGDLARFAQPYTHSVRAKNNFQKTVKETSGKGFLICPNCGVYVGMISKEEAEKAFVRA